MVERSSMDVPRSITGVPHSSHLENVDRANTYIQRQHTLDAGHSRGIKPKPFSPPKFSGTGRSGGKSLNFNTTGSLRFEDGFAGEAGGKSMRGAASSQQSMRSENGIPTKQSTFSGLQSMPSYSIAKNSGNFGTSSAAGMKRSAAASTRAATRGGGVGGASMAGASLRGSPGKNSSMRSGASMRRSSSGSFRGDGGPPPGADDINHTIVSAVTGCAVPVPPHPVADYDLDVQPDDWLTKSPLPSQTGDEENLPTTSEFEDVPVVSVLLDSGSEEVSHPEDDPPDAYFDGRLLVDESNEEAGAYLTLKTTTDKDDEDGELVRQQFAQTSNSAVFLKHVRRFGPFRGGVGHYRSGAVPQLDNIDHQLTKGMNCAFVLYGQFRQRNAELILRSLMEDHDLFERNLFCTLSCCEIVEEDVVRDLLDVNEFGHDYLPFEVLQHDDLGATVRNLSKVALRHIHDFRRAFDFACYKSALYASHAQGLFDPAVRAFFVRPLARYFVLEVVNKDGNVSPGRGGDNSGTRARFVLFEMESMQESPIRAEAVKRTQEYFLSVNQASADTARASASRPGASFLKRNGMAAAGEGVNYNASSSSANSSVLAKRNGNSDPMHASKLSILLEELLCGNFHTNIVLGCTAAAFENPQFATFDEIVHGVHLDRRVAVERSLGALMDILQFGQILSNLNEHRRKRRLAGTTCSLHAQHLQYNADNRALIREGLQSEIRELRQDQSIPFEQKDREVGLRQALLRPLDEEEVHRHSEEILAQLTLLNKRYWFSLQASRELTSGKSTKDFMAHFGVPFLYNIGAEDTRCTNTVRYYLPLGQDVELVLLPGKEALVRVNSKQEESTKEDVARGDRIIPSVTQTVDHHRGLDEVYGMSPNSFTFNYDDLFVGGSSPKSSTVKDGSRLEKQGYYAARGMQGDGGRRAADNRGVDGNGVGGQNNLRGENGADAAGIVGKAADDRAHRIFGAQGKKIVVALPNVLELGALSMLSVAHHFEGTSSQELVALQQKLLSKKRLVDARYRPALSKWAKDNLSEKPQSKIDGLSGKLQRAGGGQAAEILRKGKQALRATGRSRGAMATRPMAEKFRAGLTAASLESPSKRAASSKSTVLDRDANHVGVHISLKNVDNRRIEMRNLSLSADVLVNNEISFGGILHPHDQLLVGPYLFGLKVPKRDKSRPAAAALQPLLMDARTIQYFIPPGGSQGGKFFFNAEDVKNINLPDSVPPSGSVVPAGAPDTVTELSAQGGAADATNIAFLQALLALENGSTGVDLASTEQNQNDLVHALVQQLNKQRVSRDENGNKLFGVFEGSLEIHECRNVCDASGRRRFVIWSGEEGRYYTVDEFLTGRRDTLERLARVEQLASDCDERLDSVGRSLGMKAQDKQALDLLMARREMDAVIKRATGLLSKVDGGGNDGVSSSGGGGPMRRSASTGVMLRQPTFSSAMKARTKDSDSSKGSGGRAGSKQLSFAPPDRPFQEIVDGTPTQIPRLTEELIPSPRHRRQQHFLAAEFQRTLENTSMSSPVQKSCSKMSSPRETGVEEAVEGEKGAFMQAAERVRKLFPLDRLGEDKVGMVEQSFLRCGVLKRAYGLSSCTKTT